jgi:uncharacterized membrane protein
LIWVKLRRDPEQEEPMAAATAPTTTLPGCPVIRSITADDVYGALAAGWADFRAAPRFGLFFGGVYALVGIAIFLQLWVLDQPFWIVPFAFAFPLIGPFAAIGLYEVSRRREAGEPLDWAEVLGVVWSKRDSQIPSMAFIVLAGFMVWMWVASMIVIIFLGRMSFAVYSDFGAILSTPSGLAMLVVGGLAGAAIAFVLFAITAVSLPMLLDRDIDYVTAMVTSWQAVMSNLHPMLTWGWIVAGSLFVAMLPLFLGLIVVLPVLGHATWHLYRKVIAPEGAM